jgi:hypothetical protein
MQTSKEQKHLCAKSKVIMMALRASFSVQSPPLFPSPSLFVHSIESVRFCKLLSLPEMVCRVPQVGLAKRTVVPMRGIEVLYKEGWRHSICGSGLSPVYCFQPIDQWRVVCAFYSLAFSIFVPCSSVAFSKVLNPQVRRVFADEGSWNNN